MGMFVLLESSNKSRKLREILDVPSVSRSFQVVDPLDIEDIVARIKQLARDLEKFRDGASSQLFSPGQPALHQESLVAPGSMEIIAQFREVLDDLRQMMWLQFEVAAASKVSEPETRDKLLRRAAQILCALSVHPPPQKQHLEAVTVSYVDRLMDLVESQMETKKLCN